MIVALKVDGELYELGNKYMNRSLAKIEGYSNDPRNNPNMACFVGYDNKGKAIFTVHSTNVIAFHKEEK